MLDTISFTAGRPSTVRWQVHNQDCVALPLFPSEPAISVIIGPDPDFFWHGHAEAPTHETDVEVPITFPKAGDYLLWTETYANIGQEYQSVIGQFLLSAL